MTEKNNWLKQKISGIPSWLILGLLVLFGADRATQILTNGLISPAKSENTEYKILNDKIEKLSAAVDKLADVIQKNLINTSLNDERINRLNVDIRDIKEDLKK